MSSGVIACGQETATNVSRCGKRPLASLADGFSVEGVPERSTRRRFANCGGDVGIRYRNDDGRSPHCQPQIAHVGAS